jgi:hypothetical protein
MATYILQLSSLEFSHMGSLVEDIDGISVGGRPLSANMNCLIDLAYVPACLLPQLGITYTTSDAWYVAMAEMHMAHLVFQHNDLIYAEYDTCNKYVERLLFLRLAREGKLSTFGFEDDSWSAQSQQ